MLSQQERIDGLIRDLGLTEEQLAACDAVCDLTKSFVLRACPGSGKTRTAAAMFALLLASWDDRHSGVAMLSFTNVAWRTIEARLTQDMGFAGPPPWPHFLGTIDSFVDQFLFLPFGHIVMGCSRPVQLVTKHNQEWVVDKLAGGVPQDCRKRGCTHIDLRYDAAGRLRPTGERIRCEGGQTHCVKLKQRMISAGFATPSDAMYWGMKALDLPGIPEALAVRFPHIIIDEAQDTSDVQMAIVRRLHDAGSRVALVGDPDQAIYEFNEARPDLFVEAAGRWPLYQLRTNFRSTQAICSATHRFSCLPTPAHAGGPSMGQPDLQPVAVRYKEGALPELVGWFRSRISPEGIDPERCAILTRSRRLVSGLNGGSPDWPGKVKALVRTLATAACELAEGLVPQAHQRVMYALLRICFDKGSFGPNFSEIADIGIRRWRIVSWQLLERLPPTSVPLRSWGNLAKNAVDQVLAEAALPCALKLGANLTAYNKQGADEPIMHYAGTAGATIDIRRTTIHQAKGEEYDAVLVVCDKGQGGHPADLLSWLDPREADDEERRIGYVAMTRAKRLLALAVPDNRAHRTALNALSPQFQIIDEAIGARSE